jgi:dephospho-CoA kinase
MLKIGLTGNIGSGKSTVARIFENLGIPVFHADEVAKKLLLDKAVIDGILQKFGKDVFTNKLPDRKKLASLVFNDTEALSYLNSLIHPRVRHELKLWFEGQSHYPYAIQEAAILFESSFDKEVDFVVFVSAPVELCIKRVVTRDGLKTDDIEKRLAFQWSEEKKIELSDFIIRNDETQLLIPQVIAIHHQLQKK